MMTTTGLTKLPDFMFGMTQKQKKNTSWDDFTRIQGETVVQTLNEYEKRFDSDSYTLEQKFKRIQAGEERKRELDDALKSKQVMKEMNKFLEMLVLMYVTCCINRKRPLQNKRDSLGLLLSLRPREL